MTKSKSKTKGSIGQKEKSKQDQITLALWAAKCAEHVLPYFEKEFPNDRRPRKAIEKCREWARTGIFRMADIRKASLDSHAAAREADEGSAARFAAHAAGQAVAAAHVPEHAFGAAYYLLKIAANDSATAEIKIAEEHKWIEQQLPKNLRKKWEEWQSRRLPKHLKSLVFKN